MKEKNRTTIQTLFDGLPSMLEDCPPQSKEYREAQTDCRKWRDKLLAMANPDDKEEFQNCFDIYYETELQRENIGSSHYYELGLLLGAMLTKEILEGGDKLLKKLNDRGLF